MVWKFVSDSPRDQPVQASYSWWTFRSIQESFLVERELAVLEGFFSFAFQWETWWSRIYFSMTWNCMCYLCTALVASIPFLLVHIMQEFLGFLHAYIVMGLRWEFAKKSTWFWPTLCELRCLAYRIGTYLVYISAIFYEWSFQAFVTGNISSNLIFMTS